MVDEPDLPDLSLLYESGPSGEVESGKVDVVDVATTTTQWSDVLEQSCPLLYKLVSSHKGALDRTKLDHMLRAMKLEPCSSDDPDCLERACAALWKGIKGPKGPKGKGPKGKEAEEISRQLFRKDDLLAFKPNDLTTMYVLNKLLPPSFNNEHHEFTISRRRGDATLLVIRKSKRSTIDGYTAVRWLQTEHLDMCLGFRVVYDMQVAAKAKDLYVLQESTDGTILDLIARFGKERSWSTVYRLMIHALRSLLHLHKHGYQHNDVQIRTLHYIEDANEMTCKWSSFDCVGERGSAKCNTRIYVDPLQHNPNNSDLFAFGIAVFELLYEEHPGGTSPKRWHEVYASDAVQAGIAKLKEPNDLQPLSTLAYHLITSDVKNRWTEEHVKEWLHKGPEARTH